jgi:hypothetical protein
LIAERISIRLLDKSVPSSSGTDAQNLEVIGESDSRHEIGQDAPEKKRQVMTPPGTDGTDVR